MGSPGRAAAAAVVILAAAGATITVGSINLAAAESATATTGVNIRSGPGTEHEILGGLVRGQRITAVGDPENGWVKVRFNGSPAYISAQYLDLEGEATVQGPSRIYTTGTKVATAPLNVRSGAGLDEEVIGYVSPGENVTLTGKQSAGWVEVLYGGRRAWVSGQYLASSMYGLTDDTSSRIATADLLIRTSTDADFKIITTVEKGTELQVTGSTRGRYAQVIFDDAYRWVTAKYLTAPNATGPSGPADEVEPDDDEPAGDSLPEVVGTRYATTLLRLRDRWQDNDRTVGLVQRGDAVKITGTVRNGRAEIIDDGRTRWVTAQWLSENKPAPTDDQTDDDQSDDGRSGGDASTDKPEVTGSRHTTADLNLRTGPSLSSGIVTVLERGVKVSITDTTRAGYRQVVYSGDVRWLASDYLSRSEPEPPANTGDGSERDDSGGGDTSGGDRPRTDGGDQEPDITGTRYTTAYVNLRTGPSRSAGIVTVLSTGTKVSITDRTENGYRQVVRGDAVRWVAGDYLAKSEPEPPSSGDSDSGSGDGFSGDACPSGSAVEAGLTPDAIRVHRAVCARYPQVSTYYGLRPGDSGYHGSGQAIDIMISDRSAGWDMAYWLRANADELGVSQVIYSQRIWTVQRSSEGWRWMEDRGSPTANHYDHVHVSVYGNSASS